MRRTFMLIALLSLAVGLASAQNGAFAPYVQGSVSGTPGAGGAFFTGFTSPSYSVGVGVESSTKHLLLDANGVFNTADSTTGAGHDGVITL